MTDWLTAVEARVEANATGSLATGTPGRRICVAYVHPNGVASTDRTAKIEGGVVTSGASCFSDGRPNDERRVQVLVERDVDFNAFAFQTTIKLDANAVNRFEAALGF